MVRDKAIDLKPGQLLLKRRLNFRVRKCGGCSIPINAFPLVSPHDLIFMKKERRPKRTKKWSSTNENDFALVNIHFHPNTSCTGKFDSIESGDVQLTEVERKYLHQKNLFVWFSFLFFLVIFVYVLYWKLAVLLLGLTIFVPQLLYGLDIVKMSTSELTRLDRQEGSCLKSLLSLSNYGKN